MKKLLFLFGAVVLIGAGCSGATSTETDDIADTNIETEAELSDGFPALFDGTYFVKEGSQLTWEGTAVGKKHVGTVDVASGGVNVAEGSVFEGEFTFDMTSISSTDLEGSLKEQLDGHLKADDFFGVETYPTAKIEITEVRENVLIANLTVKETTEEIEIPFDVSLDNEDSFNVTATYEMDRSVWDVRYGSLKFFSDIGDAAISDIMTIELDLVLELQS